MTKLRYPKGCAAGSQERGIASSPSDYAWNVNFNNGNYNWNNQTNEGFVRAVRPGVYPSVSFAALYAAWREARRGKKPSANQLGFDTRWLDGLLGLHARLSAGTWSPAPPTCFIAKEPKAREIHAPDFADRIVHHWLVPQLECIYEPIFIHDVYSNRLGKGTHAAVARLKDFVRQVEDGQSGGWYLQLDVRNFFNSIHRPTLVIYPRFTVVRRRVIRHACDRLDRWQARHVRFRFLIASPAALNELRSVCASYAGHFSHANSWRLRQQFSARYPWLGCALRRRSFDHRLGNRPLLIPRIDREAV